MRYHERMAARDVILARRARFVAAALAGVTTASTCGGEVETEGSTSSTATSSAASVSASSVGGAQVCLSMQIGGEGGARACLAPPPNSGGGGAGGR